ncbi:MAG: hypothetical protein LBO66_08630 [Deltaproteobacteria bacterium]|jgi:predicted nucleotidyltransferase|nr:hypothetical protein [Deltaproteobacteria bacterium]
MDKEKILALLTELGKRLAVAGIQAEMVIFGGAAMSLVHDSRRSTNDIDAVFSPRTEVFLIALEIHQERNLPLDWLNSAGDIFVNKDAPTVDYMDFPGLKVKVVAPDYLLAMKIKSSRQQSHDFSDTRFLINKLGVKTREDAESLVRQYFPKFKLTEDCATNLEQAFTPS